VWLTDGDASNARGAEGYLTRAGLWERTTFLVGDAVTSFAGVDGEFDIVYCDIDKEGYPDAWRAARDRIGAGGLYICDNTLWSGRVTEEKPDDAVEGRTEAIREHNRMIAEDDRYLSMILPIRDGVMVALRVS
jgi:predicted O-methyltransferase YrrM